MQPYNVKTTKRDLINRLKDREEQEKIDPELKRMHEIFGDPNANAIPREAAHVYDDGTVSRIAYDPDKLTSRRRLQIQPLTETETQAEKMYRFTHILGNRKSRNEY